MMSDITKEEVRERLGNIDQIRDIIFGSQLRDYDNRLDRLESDTAIFQQEMRDRIDQIKAILATELRTATDLVEKKLKTLSLKSQEDSVDLQQQVDRIQRKFSSNIESLDVAIDKQEQELRSELLQTRTNLQNDVLALRDMVFEELDRRFALVREGKVSKDDMAEALFELALRMKGTEFVPKLRELASKADSDAYIPLLETRKIAERIA
jgi:hypothetical protein